MTEAQLQDAVIELARTLRFLVAHFRPARTSSGWRTAVSADGAGYPDLTIAGHGRIIFAELKADKGRLSDHQENWLATIDETGSEWFIWQPAHWLNGEIEAELRSGTPHERAAGLQPARKAGGYQPSADGTPPTRPPATSGPKTRVS